MEQIFYTNDKVKHPEYGKGFVLRVEPDDFYPVKVRFNDTSFETFTHDGRTTGDTRPTLTFLNGTQFDYGTPSERKWIPTEVHWAYVWNIPPRLDLKVLIVNYKFDGKEPYIDMYGMAWSHAEPCNPPEWKGDNHGR